MSGLAERRYNIAKIHNDKYYTPIDLANYCINKTIEVVGLNNISESIEPSVGNGSFLHNDKLKITYGYDIQPEIQQDNIFTQDFLTSDIVYKKGRLIIGNPPYGRCLSLAQKFFKKSVDIADYISFILPISQLNNTQSMYEFDLLHSEDLGTRTYTDRGLHCCLNIYGRPKSGILNTRPKTKLKDISIYRQDSSGYDSKAFDIRMCYWGDGTAGKILKNGENYSAEYKIKIHNEELKPQIINLLQTFDWKSYLKCIAMRKIQQFHIVDVLIKNIDGIN